MYSIENDTLRVAIDPVGAELSSIIKKFTKAEYIWQGNPEIWSSQAPVLFPIIGGLKQGRYIFNNQTYQLPKHGFIRYNKDLKVYQQSDEKVSFTLESSEKTLAAYPFQFVFEISFELLENEIKVTHLIKNVDSQTMYFSVGGHPAFNCPLYPEEEYNDYYISLVNGTGDKSYLLTDDGLITENTVPVFTNNQIQLTPNLFNNDALIFKNIKANEAVLHHNTKGAIVRMKFEDFPDLGIWAKPKAPFVCLEPWLGYADVEHTTQQLIEKEGIQRLEQGEIHYSTYTIEIC